MEDSTQNEIKIHDQNEALNYVTTQVRQNWSENYPELGEATIAQESELEGHKVWQYHIDGLPMTRDGRKRWLLDTGETFDTTINQNENTLELAYAKLRGQSEKDEDIKSNLAKLLGVNVEDLSEDLIKGKAASLLGINVEDLAISDVADEVGVFFYETRDGESLRGGKALIIGNDGGLLAVGSVRPPQDYVQAYKDGQRTSEDQFNSPS